MFLFWIAFILKKGDEFILLLALNVLPVLNPASYFCLHSTTDSDPKVSVLLD